MLQKNLDALKETLPLLAENAAQWTAEGVEVFKAAAGGITARFLGRYIHSPRAPLREAQRLIEAAVRQQESAAEKDENARAAVLFGFGLGYAAEEIAALYPNLPIIIVERRKEIFRAALQSRDLSALFSRSALVFVLGDDAHSLLAALEAVKKTGIVIKNRSLCEIDRDFYDEAERLLETWASKDSINSATLKKFGGLWRRNREHNQKFLNNTQNGAKNTHNVSDLFGKLPFPALVLAAGPSLDEITPYIKALSERALVIACDTALRFLFYKGIAPHFAVSADAQFWNYLHIAGLPADFLQKINLVTETAVYPALLSQPFKRRFLFAPSYPAAGKADAANSNSALYGKLGAGGSVATTAWDFARALGARSIWAAGLDLSFPQYRTHYRGALFEERVHFLSTRLKPAMTFCVKALRAAGPFYAQSADGGQTLTDKRLSLYAAWFENALKTPPAEGAFRLESGGLFIKGFNLCCAQDMLRLPVIKNEIEEALGNIPAAIP